MRLNDVNRALSNLKNNNIYYCFTLLLLLLFQNSYSQNNTNNNIDNNSVTVEVFGHSRSLFSVNYERLLKLPSDYFFCALRTGVGYSPWVNMNSGRHKGTLTVPAVLSLVVGKKKHYAQLCFGYSASFGEDFIDSTTTTPTIYQKFESTYSLSLGYRYMWNGFVGQAYPLLQWTNNPSSKFSIGGGVSIGVTF